MNLSDEEKRNLEAVSSAVEENKPVETLINTDSPQGEEVRGYRTGIDLGPVFAAKELAERDNTEKEYGSHHTIGKIYRDPRSSDNVTGNKPNEKMPFVQMGAWVEPKGSFFTNLIRKIFKK